MLLKQMPIIKIWGYVYDIYLQIIKYHLNYTKIQVFS